ncbi:MAG: efflux RND transporter periplasmic adaptor subunit [Planctomycetaceae bacterium]
MWKVLRFATPLLILAGGIGGLIVFGQRPEVPQKKRDDNSVPLVETAKASAYRKPMILEAEGNAVTFRRVTLSAEVGGRLVWKSKRCLSGNYVEKNESLFKVDPTYLQAEVDRLNGQLRQSNEELAGVDVDIANTQSSLKIAKERLVLKQKKLARYLRIAMRNSLTEDEVDDARLDELSAREAVQSLKNQLAKQQQQKKTLTAARDLVNLLLKPATTDLKRAEVHSPLNGTIIAVHAQQNDYVQKGTPLVTLNDTSHVEVQCNLRVDDIYWIWLQSGKFQSLPSKMQPRQRLQIPATRVEVVYPFHGLEYIWEGELNRYDGTGLDEKTRTVPCRILIKHPQKVRVKQLQSTQPKVIPPTLFTGMYVKIRIPIQSPVPLLKIPMSSLKPGRQVWVVRDGKLRIFSVRIARPTSDDHVLIVHSSQGGVQPGDSLVVSPLASVLDGMPVKKAAEQ